MFRRLMLVTTFLAAFSCVGMGFSNSAQAWRGGWGGGWGRPYGGYYYAPRAAFYAPVPYRAYYGPRFVRPYYAGYYPYVAYPDYSYYGPGGYYGPPAGVSVSFGY